LPTLPILMAILLLLPKKHKQMNKLSIILTNILIILVTSCNSGEGEDVASDNKLKEKEITKKLLVEDYDFAVFENNNFITYNKAIYHRGDEVFMVLKNVGQFARGKDSLNRAEMKMEIFDAIGQRITIRENLFGLRGHADFKNNILKKPYASYETDSKDKIGKYNFKVTIFDLISGDSTFVNDDFYIE